MPIISESETNQQLRWEGEPQEIMLMRREKQNQLLNARRGNDFLSGSAPTMNVLQCASATCFCHRFAMLSCLNLIGWRGGWVGFGAEQVTMLLMLRSHRMDPTV